MESVKRIVWVTIEKELEIELMPSVFGNRTEEEYLEDFRKKLRHVDNIDDVVKYAARCAATGGMETGGDGYHFDGIGLVAEYPYLDTAPDVKFRVTFDDCDVEIVKKS